MGKKKAKPKGKSAPEIRTGVIFSIDRRPMGDPGGGGEAFRPMGSRDYEARASVVSITDETAPEPESTADRQRIAILESQLPSTIYRRKKSVKLKPAVDHDDDGADEPDAVVSTTPIRDGDAADAASAPLRTLTRAGSGARPPSELNPDWDLMDAALDSVTRLSEAAAHDRVASGEDESPDIIDGYRHTDPLRRRAMTIDRETIKQRRETIRAVPMRIQERRKIREELLATELRATRRVPRPTEACCSRLSKGCGKIGSRIKKIFSKSILWRSQLRHIRCSHGLGVYSFFLFLRWLLLLNLLISLVSSLPWFPFFLGVVLTKVGVVGTGEDVRFRTAPRILDFSSSSSSSSSATPPRFRFVADCASRLDDAINASDAAGIDAYELDVAALYNQMALVDPAASSCEAAMTPPSSRALVCTLERKMLIRRNEETKDLGLKIVDVFQGTGWISGTHLFLGAFHNLTWNSQLDFLDFGSSFLWNSGLASIVVVAMTFLISLALTLKSSGNFLYKSYLESQGQYNKFTNLVLSGWDFGVRNEKAKMFKQTELYHQMRQAVRTCHVREIAARMSTCEKFRLHARRFIVHVICIIVIGALIYVITIVSNFSLKESSSYGARPTSGSNFYLLLIDFLPSLLITLVNSIFPPFVDLLVYFEKREPDSEVIFTLIRTVFLRLSSVFFLAANFYYQITSSAHDSCGNLVEERGSGNRTIDCWENYVGSQMWKLALTDALALFLKSMVIDSLKRLAVEKGVIGKIFMPEFYIPGHVLDLMYCQTLCWMGMLFCPIMPIFTTLKIFLCFYYKRFTVDVNCEPSSKIYRPEKSQAFFRKLLLVSLFVSCVPVLFCVTQMSPSHSCGPFRALTTGDRMWNVVAASVSVELPLEVKEAFDVMFSSLVLTVFVLVLFSAWLYYHTKSGAMEGMMSVLKEMLEREEENRRHLLRRAQKATRRRMRKRRPEAEDTSALRNDRG